MTSEPAMTEPAMTEPTKTSEPSVAAQRYTREELLQLRNSPLVRKPDGLPSIEQWMEAVLVSLRLVRPC